MHGVLRFDSYPLIFTMVLAVWCIGFQHCHGISFSMDANGSKSCCRALEKTPDISRREKSQEPQKPCTGPSSSQATGGSELWWEANCGGFYFFYVFHLFVFILGAAKYKSKFPIFAFQSSSCKKRKK